MGKGKGSGWGFGFGSGDYKGEYERFWIPALPIPIAIVCCVLNFLIPGLGTGIAGLCVFCCARTEDMDGSGKAKSCLVNCGIGFLQLLAAIVMFLGWCWSCYWGIAFLMMSVEYYHNNRVEDQDTRAATNTTATPTTCVVNNPSAVVVQPTHVPYRVVQTQSGSQPGPNVIIHQPSNPPPYAETSYGGTNPSVYPVAMVVHNVDGSAQKVM